MAEKMTQKEMFALIAEAMADNAEVVEFCNHKIELLEKPRKAKVNTEAVEFAAGVATALAEADEPMTNKDLAAQFEVSSQKMAAALRRLVNEGAVERIEGEGTKNPATFKLA